MTTMPVKYIYTVEIIQIKNNIYGIHNIYSDILAGNGYLYLQHHK